MRICIKDNRKKLLVIVISIVSFVIIFSVFTIMHYKKIQTGNNIGDKTLSEVENYILNISSYNAEIAVIVECNKITNKYIINQKFAGPNVASQVVVEPKNIEGLTIKYDGTNLQISNTKLNLNNIYENYTYVAENVLWLSDFINNYKKNGGNITEKDGIIVMETKCDINKYSAKEKLYIDRNANKISKLIIEDNNKKNRIYITYNKIEIDSLNKENVLAFEEKRVITREI